MTRRQRLCLWFLQLLLLLTTVAAASLTPEQLACLICLCLLECRTGSDHPKTAQGLAATSLSTAPGVVERWHDIDVTLPEPQRLEAKDLAFLRGWLPGNVIVGLKVPTAPGASAPGTVLESELRLWLQRQGGSTIDMEISLTSRDDLAAQVAAVFPPEPGSRWQALVPANNDYLGLIPTQAATFLSSSGYWYYKLDFHGTSLCNGCQLECTVCTPSRFPPDLRLATKLLPNGLRIRTVGGLTCAELLPTTIHLSPEGGQPAPAPQPAAWLSAWGGPAFASTHDPTVQLDYTLGHNVPTRQTFQLEPIQSDLGWSYQWRNMSGQPITQITIDTTLPPPAGWDSNLRIVGTIPITCQVALDTIHITATSLTSSTLQATNVSLIQALPDPTRCTTADLGLSKVVSRSVITAGQTVTFTLTVTNYETTTQNGILTDILSPASALGALNLPPDCVRVGNEVVCQVRALPPGGRRTLALGVQVAQNFRGTLSNVAILIPAQGVDLRGYDNIAGPLTVTVTAPPGPPPLFLPLILRS